MSHGNRLVRTATADCSADLPPTSPRVQRLACGQQGVGMRLVARELPAAGTGTLLRRRRNDDDDDGDVPLTAYVWTPGSRPDAACAPPDRHPFPVVIRRRGARGEDFG